MKESSMESGNPVATAPRTKASAESAARPAISALGIGKSGGFRSWLRTVLGEEAGAVADCEHALRRLRGSPADLIAVDLDGLDVAPERGLELLRGAAPLAALVGVSRSGPAARLGDLGLHRAGMALHLPLDSAYAEVGELLHEMAERPAALRADIERHSRLARCLSQFETWSANSVERLDEWVHEMRTPLGVIRGFSGNLIDGVYGEVNEAQMRALQRIASASGLLGGVVGQVRDDLPAPPRAETDAAPPRQGGRTQIDVGELAVEVRELFAQTAESGGVTIAVEAEPMTPIWGERLRLLQAGVNLVKNALRFTPKGGRVWIGIERTTWQDQPACRLSVADTGRGIDSDSLTRIFESGWTTDTAEGHQGLGLAVVRQVVREHGGKLDVDSTPGKGTIFKLTIPVDPRQRRGARSVRILHDDAVALELLSELGRRRVRLEELDGGREIESLCDELLAGGPQVTVLAVERNLCSRITQLLGKRAGSEDEGRTDAEDSDR